MKTTVDEYERRALGIFGERFEPVVGGRVGVAAGQSERNDIGSSIRMERFLGNVYRNCVLAIRLRFQSPTLVSVCCSNYVIPSGNGDFGCQTATRQGLAIHCGLVVFGFTNSGGTITRFFRRR